jgi:hypothetical protein
MIPKPSLTESTSANGIWSLREGRRARTLVVISAVMQCLALLLCLVMVAKPTPMTVLMGMGLGGTLGGLGVVLFLWAVVMTLRKQGAI